MPSRIYRLLDPRYWLLESPVRLVLWVMLVHALIHYLTLPVALLVDPSTFDNFHKIALSFFYVQGEVNSDFSDLPPILSIMAYLHWHATLLMVPALYLYLYESGRLHSIVTISTREMIDVPNPIREAFLYSDVDWPGGFKPLSDFKRVFVSTYYLIFGGFITLIYFKFPQIIMLFSGRHLDEMLWGFIFMSILMSCVMLYFIIPAIAHIQLIYQRFFED